MSWERYTDSLLESGHLSGATVLGRNNGQIWASSGDSLSAADCRSVWAGYQKGDCTEIALRGALHKNKMPGSVEDGMCLVSGTSGVIVVGTEKVMVLGLYEEEKGHSAGSSLALVERVAEHIRENGYS